MYIRGITAYNITNHNTPLILASTHNVIGRLHVTSYNEKYHALASKIKVAY